MGVAHCHDYDSSSSINYAANVKLSFFFFFDNRYNGSQTSN